MEWSGIDHVHGGHRVHGWVLIRYVDGMEMQIEIRGNIKNGTKDVFSCSCCENILSFWVVFRWIIYSVDIFSKSSWNSFSKSMTKFERNDDHFGRFETWTTSKTSKFCLLELVYEYLHTHTQMNIHANTHAQTYREIKKQTLWSPYYCSEQMTLFLFCFGLLYGIAWVI